MLGGIWKPNNMVNIKMKDKFKGGCRVYHLNIMELQFDNK